VIPTCRILYPTQISDPKINSDVRRRKTVPNTIYTIRIKYDPVTHTYPYKPLQTDMAVDDKIEFITDHDCSVWFDPVNVFGTDLKLRVGANGPYPPDPKTPPSTLVSFCITDINLKCTPPPPRLETYSIKVG
jgi:hypothetical protein